MAAMVESDFQDWRVKFPAGDNNMCRRIAVLTRFREVFEWDTQ